MRHLAWRTQGKLALRVIRQRLGDPAPLCASIFVTDRCNVRCDGCVFYDSLHVVGRAQPEDLSTLLRIQDALQAEGVPVVNYAGGEPFLRDDLPEVLFAGHARGFSQTVVTNGMIDAPRTIEACDATCDAVAFSPHPPEELGGSGAEERWEAAWTGLARLRAGLRRPELMVKVTLGRHTAPRLHDIIARAVDLGADSIRCQTNFYRSQFPSSEQLVDMRRVLEWWTVREPKRMDHRSFFLDHLESYFGETPRISCTADRKFNVGIHLDGTVSACCAQRVIIGNIFQTPLAQMHTRPEQKRHDCFGCHRTDIIQAQRYCGA